MALREKIEGMIQKIFAKQMEKFLQKTGASLTDAKVPVVGSDATGNPLFNTSSIGSADLAKLSGANGIDGTIAEAISGLKRQTYVYSFSSDLITTTKNFDGIRTTWTNISDSCALFCKLYIPPTEENVDSPNGDRGDWVCFQRQYSKNSYVQQFAWRHNVVDRIWIRVWIETSWSDWKILVDAS